MSENELLVATRAERAAAAGDCLPGFKRHWFSSKDGDGRGGKLVACARCGASNPWLPSGVRRPKGEAPEHGTYARYNYWRCRCDDCRQANRVRKRVERTGDPGAGLKTAQHGSRTKYVAGCRCGLCKEANRVYQREIMRTRRAEGKAS